MTTTLLVLQVVIVLLLVSIILLQKSSESGLSGLSGGGHNFISSKNSKNLLTKITIVLAIAFMGNAILIARFRVNSSKVASEIIKSIETNKELFVPKIKKQGEINIPIAK